MFELSIRISGMLKELLDVSKPLERTMCFIDGGYLQSTCKKLFGHDKIDFAKVGSKLREAFQICLVGQFQIDLIRIYYYDAIVEATHQDYHSQKQYFNSVYDAPLYSVRLGSLVESPKVGFRQKGVDILMSTDVLTKAYRNQYGAGIFLMGDRDFVPLIEAVNDAGKKTVCVYYPPFTSEELLKTFDMSIGLGKSEIEDLLEKS